MQPDIAFVKEWVAIADRDLDMARMASQHLPGHHDMICFHCQQAAEKYVKGYLSYLSISFAKTHDIVMLLSLLDGEHPFSSDLFDYASILTNYAVEVRYPMDTHDWEHIDVNIALIAAEGFRAEILKRLSHII